MAYEKENIIKLGIDAIKGKVSGNFSAAQTSEAFIDALIAANGDSTKIDIKTFQRGNAVFDIMEEILPYITEEGLKGNEFFMELVDYRNVASGDAIDFWTEDPATFIVADVSNGNQGIRRQRLNGGEKVSIKTTLKAVKVYEELNRLLAKRTDFNTFIKKVGEAFNKKMFEDVYTAFKGITATTVGLNSNYVITGTYSEDALIQLIEHVEAATGKIAKIVGTKAALRKVTTATIGEVAKTDMYNLGFYGRFNGTDMIAVKQEHKVGTDTFILDDTKIYVIASDDKPIKVVNEGVGYLSVTEPFANADMTQEYFYGQAYGVGVIFTGKMGILNVG